MIVPRALTPVTNGVPIDLKRRLRPGPTLKCRFHARNTQQPVKPVSVEVVNDRLVWHLVLTKLARRAGLQAALYGIAKEIVCSRPSQSLNENFSISHACIGQQLQIRPIHASNVSAVNVLVSRAQDPD